MKITSSFNRWYWKNIIKDIKDNLKEPIVWNDYKIRLSGLSMTSIHELLKMLTSFPKNEDGRPKSLTEINSKELTNHLEDIRKLMSDNGFTFYVDELEWSRAMLLARN